MVNAPKHNIYEHIPQTYTKSLLKRGDVRKWTNSLHVSSSNMRFLMSPSSNPPSLLRTHAQIAGLESACGKLLVKGLGNRYYAYKAAVSCTSGV